MTATKSPEISILEALLVEYVRDMSEWFDFHGTYDLASFWPTGKAYLAWVDDTPAGFALMKRQPHNNDVQEFFVKREFRRQGVGETLARQLWKNHPGRWSVRVLGDNTAALSFWRRTVPSSAQESGRIVNRRAWRVFTFHTVRDRGA